MTTAKFDHLGSASSLGPDPLGTIRFTPESMMYRVWLLCESIKGKMYWIKTDPSHPTWAAGHEAIAAEVEGEDNAVGGISLPSNISPATENEM